MQVQWIDNKRGRVLTSDDRIEFDDIINEIVDGYEKYGVQRQVVGDLTTYMLIIRRLALTDAGTYTCQINVKASHIHPSKDGMLVVLSASILTPLSLILDRCYPWPHVANRHISISQLLSLLRPQICIEYSRFITCQSNIVSDLAIYVLKRDVKLQLTNLPIKYQQRAWSRSSAELKSAKWRNVN